MDKRSFILDTLMPYYHFPETCGMENGRCCYLTENGNKCAVGKHMEEGEWQKRNDTIYDLLKDYPIEKVLTKEALAQNLSMAEWMVIQLIHDGIASGAIHMDKRVEKLERITGLKFPELIFKS